MPHAPRFYVAAAARRAQPVPPLGMIRLTLAWLGVAWLACLAGGSGCADAADLQAAAAAPTSASVSASAPVDQADQATAAPAVEHRHHRLPGPVAVDVVSFDLASPELRIEAIIGAGVRGTEPVAAMVQGMDRALGRPIAAVNGDYFEFATEPRYLGTLQGTTIVRGELVSTPGFPTFWVDRDNQPHLATPRAGFRVTWPDGAERSFALNASTSDFRSEVRAGPIVLFTPAFGSSTSALAGGRELVLERVDDDRPDDPDAASPWLPLRPNVTLTARIRSIHDQGDASIPEDGMVLSIAKAAVEGAPAAAVGDVLTLRTDVTPDLSTAYAAVAGAPLLLVEGELAPGLDDVHRHPRTAVGFAGQRVWLVVVDGRQPGRSIGMSHLGMARYMLELGCTDAVNLDGGGSSTLWLRGRVANVPSAGRPRAVGNALVVTHRPRD